MAAPIYLDNAATTFPKPDSVYVANDEYVRNCANPGRGAHKMAVESARTIFDARLNIATFLGVKRPERIVFTPGCTYSINFALKGLPLRSGDVVVVGPLEHNAVMRPLRQLERERGIRVEQLPYAPKGIVDLKAFINSMLQLHPKLVVLSEASNVTGECIDLRSIAAICGAHKVPLMIDAAQTAGRSTIGLDESGVAIWCASGHKKLFGLPGAGLLYVGESVELEPLVAGGTGSNSEQAEMPGAYPDHLEAGTLPGPAIAALAAGVRWLSEKGVAAVTQREHQLTDQFLEWAQRSGLITVYGGRSPGDKQAPIVSFAVPGVSCDRVAAMLDQQFGIAVRHGLDCAPSAHQVLGTLESGLVRASFSYFNTSEQARALAEALTSIATARDTGVISPTA